MKDIIQELVDTNKWLGGDYKNSNYYREYLDKVNEDLKAKTFNYLQLMCARKVRIN